jgi:hypothetical protein
MQWGQAVSQHHPYTRRTVFIKRDGSPTCQTRYLVYPWGRTHLQGGQPAGQRLEVDSV